MESNQYTRLCAGPGIHANTEHCLSPGGKWHVVTATGDNKQYNGVIQWRCQLCFNAHRKAIADSRTK